MSDVSSIGSRSLGAPESPDRVAGRAVDRVEVRAVERPGDDAGALRLAARGGDRVEFSDAAHFLAKLRETSGVREDVVARVKGEIEAGAYDGDALDAKIDAVLDRIIDDLYA